MEVKFYRLLTKIFKHIFKYFKKENDALVWSVYKSEDPLGFGLSVLEARLNVLGIPHKTVKYSERTRGELTEIYLPREYLEKARQIMLGEL